MALKRDGNSIELGKKRFRASFALHKNLQQINFEVAPLDPKMVAHVNAVARIPFIHSTWSCEGHLDDDGVKVGGLVLVFDYNRRANALMKKIRGACRQIPVFRNY